MIFLSEKTQQHFYDASSKDLLKMSRQTPKFVKRSKEQIFSYYQGTDKDGTVNFITPSGTTPGKYWKQKVKMLDLPKLLKLYRGKRTPKDIINMALKGNVAMSCDDPEGGSEPSWIYWGFKYKATMGGWGLGREDRFPKIRNPRLKGSTCKHLNMVLSNLPFHLNMIVRDLKKHGVFEGEDDEGHKKPIKK